MSTAQKFAEAAAMAAPVARPDRARSNRFLAVLPAADYALLAPHLRQVSLTRGSILHDAGDPIEHVYFPHIGMVSIVATMRDGAMVETATFGRVGVICVNAALGSRHAVGKAVVQLPGTASRLALAQFEAAARASSAIRDLAARYNDLLLIQLQQSVACNALHGLEQRLCRWLLQTHDNCDSDTLPLTQEFLGQMLGVRRTSVTIAARLLQSEGIISYRRGHIHIVNRAALEQTACECYFTLREHVDRLLPRQTSI